MPECNQNCPLYSHRRTFPPPEQCKECRRKRQGAKTVVTGRRVRPTDSLVKR